MGGNAQIKAMKQVAGQLRLDLAQFRELEAFAKFGSDLDKATQAQLRRGESMMELLKQDQYSPLTIERQVVVTFLGVRGYVDDITVEHIRKFETDFIKFMDTEGKEVLDSIVKERMLTDETIEKLIKLVKEFKSTFIVE